jgi:hypothetical protein
VSTAAGVRRSPVRLVLGTGILAGTALQAFAMLNGVRASWPGLPPLPGTIVGFVLEWLTAVVLATLAIELLRRYYRIATGGAVRAARAGGGSLGGRLTAWAARRWQQRQAEHAGAPAPSVTAAQAPPAVQAPPAPAPILVAAPAAAAAPVKNGDTPMTATDPPPVTAPPPPRRPANLPTPSALWRAVAAAAADFDPESEAETAAWLREQAAGLLLYAEGLMGAHSNTVDGRGVDPKAMQLLHEAADTCAEAAGTIAGAARDVITYFAEVREFVQAGKTMTKDGRWITGEGD